MICNKCNWVHFPITRKEAEEQAKSFGDYINSQSPEIKEHFGLGILSKSKKEWNFKEHVSSSEKCFRCGNDYHDFHEETEKDLIPKGSTIQGIIKD